MKWPTDVPVHVQILESTMMIFEFCQGVQYEPLFESGIRPCLKEVTSRVLCRSKSIFLDWAKGLC